MLPWALALVLAATALCLFLEDIRAAAPSLLLGLFVAWSLGGELELLRLERSWGLGPATLSEAAGVSTARGAPTVSVAWLRPSGGSPYRLESRTMAVEGLDGSGESLEKIFRYLRARRFHSIFAAQGMRALRRGWRLWWDTGRALEADMVAEPGVVVPDYRGALALLKAGPLTDDRFGKLAELARDAGPRREGFEDVTQSQYIFEAFSAAYARFGDEGNSRSWLYRVDNLWPIYEKKIEVSPLENFREGRITGRILENGEPSSSVIVGLFYLPLSTSAAKTDGILSASDIPDTGGRFAFTGLGEGSYYLGLMAPAGKLGRVGGSPGPILISAGFPESELPPLEIGEP
jgi:hypothetical protein